MDQNAIEKFNLLRRELTGHISSKELTPSVSLLYFELLSLFLIAGFPDSLRISWKTINEETGLSLSTIGAAKRILAEKKLITFQKGGNQKSTVYRLLSVPKSTTEQSSEQSVPKSATEQSSVPNSGSDTKPLPEQSVPKSTTEQSSVPNSESNLPTCTCTNTSTEQTCTRASENQKGYVNTMVSKEITEFDPEIESILSRIQKPLKEGGLHITDVKVLKDLRMHIRDDKCTAEYLEYWERVAKSGKYGKEEKPIQSPSGFFIQAVGKHWSIPRSSYKKEG